MYYADKLDSLRSLFGVQDVVLGDHYVAAGDRRFPIIEDVIVLSEPGQHTRCVNDRLQARKDITPSPGHGFAKDIQCTFGHEWQEYSEILPEHRQEFAQYFDLVDLRSLRESRVGDLGCGNGRWSYFLKDSCREIVLVDFSDSIFVARKNLADSKNCLFFMADLQRLPFQADCFDFLVCLGVLHHLPTPCLEAVRNLGRFAPRLLIFLYYAMDNRPAYFRWLLRVVSVVRRAVCRVKHASARKLIAKMGTYLLYLPMIGVGRVLDVVRLGRFVPLYEFYKGKSLRRIEQDAYDRFFTRIEQRVSQNDISELQKVFSRLVISEQSPYWHFLCVR